MIYKQQLKQYYWKGFAKAMQVSQQTRDSFNWLHVSLWNFGMEPSTTSALSWSTKLVHKAYKPRLGKLFTNSYMYNSSTWFQLKAAVSKMSDLRSQNGIIYYFPLRVYHWFCSLINPANEADWHRGSLTVYLCQLTHTNSFNAGLVYFVFIFYIQQKQSLKTLYLRGWLQWQRRWSKYNNSFVVGYKNKLKSHQPLLQIEDVNNLQINYTIDGNVPTVTEKLGCVWVLPQITWSISGGKGSGSRMDRQWLSMTWLLPYFMLFYSLFHGLACWAR